MRKRAAKKLVFFSSALVIIGIGSVVVHRYPLFSEIVSVQRKYAVHQTPGMYTVPSQKKPLANRSCSPLVPENSDQIEIGHLTLTVPVAEVVNEQGVSELKRIEFTGNRVIVVLPEIPPVEKIAPGSSIHLQHKFPAFLLKNRISTHKDLVSYLLRITPHDLSVLDDPTTIIGKIVSLHLKYVMVPHDGDHAYEFTLSDKLTGYLIENKENTQALKFLHFFDSRGQHHKLIFYLFGEQDIACILSRIVFR